MSRSSRALRRFLALSIVMWFFVGVGAHADDVYSRIRGIVTDPSGAVVAGVQVTARNIDTGITRQLMSGANGAYEFLNLQPGNYAVTASKSGFKTFKVSGIKLVVTKVYVQNVVMDVGTVNQSVEVSANPVQVETTTMQLGSTLNNETIVNMPLAGRNWINLQLTLPGVVSAESRFTSSYSTNGSQGQQNAYLINGNDSNDITMNTPMFSISPDAIAEVQMITNTMNPEYGRNSGAVMNAVTKAGTNAFHGSAFNFYRDTSLNASDYFTNKPAVLHQNQFGGTISGPIWKNHTFFFYSYQGRRYRQPQSGGNVTVLTDPQRRGDFSNSQGNCPFGSNLSPRPMYDSNRVLQPAGTSYCDLWPNGVVDSRNFDPLAVSLLNKYVPSPTSGRKYTFSPVRSGTDDQNLTRIDHTFSEKDAIWGYWLWERRPDQQTLPTPTPAANLPGFTQTDQLHQQQYTLAWNHTFSPTLLNELRLGYTRSNYKADSPLNPGLPSDYGFENINPQNTAGASMPYVGVTGMFNLGFTTNGPQPRIVQTKQVVDNLSKIVGNHTFKVGFTGSRYYVWNQFAGHNNGSFSFGGGGPYSVAKGASATKDNSSKPYLPGLDFLLGIPDSYAQGAGSTINATAGEYYAYFQDQWKATNHLTITYGTGYQVDTPLTQHYNNGLAVICWQPGVQSKVFPTAPAGITYPGDSGCNNSMGVTTKWNHFAPRFGFAWSPDLGVLSGGTGKLAIRGGYGIYYNRHEEELMLQALGQPPFGYDFSVPAGFHSSFKNPYVDIRTGAAIPGGNPFPFTPPQAGSAVDFSQFYPLSLSLMDPKFATPYAQNFNLTIERELPAQIIARVGYVGALGRKLVVSSEMNPGINAQGCAADPACANDGMYQYIDYPQNFKYAGDVYGSLTMQGTRGSSNYNALQVSVTKRQTHGLDFTASYSWSHSRDVASSFEDIAFTGVRGSSPNFDLSKDWGDSAFDARHRLVISYNYVIPSLHKYSSYLPEVVFGGWRLSGITTFQGGFPILIGDGSSYASLTCPGNIEYYSCWERPNLVAPVGILNPKTSPDNAYFTTTSFEQSAPGTLGNTPRNFFHGPGVNNTDVTLAKETRISERFSTELRVEIFNLFNRTEFSNPDGDLNSATFGQIDSTSRNPRFIQLGAKLRF